MIHEEDDVPPEANPQRVIVQYAAPDALNWTGRCMETVKLYAKEKGCAYVRLGNELFAEMPIAFLGFPKRIQADYARLQFLHRCLQSGFAEAIWIESDTCIWDLRLSIPTPKEDEVVCALEAVQWSGPALLGINNTVLSFSRPIDVVAVMKEAERILLRTGDPHNARSTIISFELFSQREFPLKRVELKSVGVLTAPAIQEVCRANRTDLDGNRHECPALYRLGLLHGATLMAARLCAPGVSPWTLDACVGALVNIPHRDLPAAQMATPFLRAFHRCWAFFKRLG